MQKKKLKLKYFWTGNTKSNPGTVKKGKFNQSTDNAKTPRVIDIRVNVSSL